ncbi:MAG: tetraacyldisaccharide 4'-kinase [Bacteriovoracaceae bacterium]|nr:tetraacyldisaccharide 4'-kinase [Bacteriovoracaceae bacterium]
MAKMLNSLFNIFLSPLSVIWDVVHRMRRFFYYYGLLPRHNFQVPIISIGNLTFGGTGKTPFTLWLGSWLLAKNKNVMVLSRGYKGKLENSSGIIRAGRRLGFNPNEYGDEASLLARRLKNATIVVGKNRSANLDYYFDSENPDIVLLDDGHQHLKLGRNVNIVLFDATMPLDSYRVAPLGYMRENFHALRDTSVVVFTRSDQVTHEKLEDLKNKITPYVGNDVLFVKLKYTASGLFDLSYRKMFELNDLAGKKVIAVAGIASPNSFYKILEENGAEVVEKMAYPDHHYFKSSEMEDILAKASKHEAIVVTTEKDMVKMRRIVDDNRIVYLEIKTEFVEGEEKLKELLTSVFEFKM